MQRIALLIFLLGLLLACALGTETRLLLFWPGAAVLGLAGLVAAARWRWKLSFAPGALCLATALLFTVYMAVRACFSPVAEYAREDLFLLAGAWVCYLFAATLGGHPRWRLVIFGVLLALVVGNLAVGAVHFSGQWQFHLVPGLLRPASAGRIGGLFPNANHLGAFLVMAFFLLAGVLCFGRGRAAVKACLAFLLLTVLIGVALTASRGALIGLAAGSAVFVLMALALVWQTQRHLFGLLVAAGLVLAGGGGMVLWKVNEEQLKQRELASPMADDVRLQIWPAALAQHAESPLVGAGARMFYDGSMRYRSPDLPGLAGDALFAHNEYLQMLADYGWIGLGLLVAMLIAHGVNGAAFLRWYVQHRFLQSGRLQSMQLAFCVGALGACTAMAVHAVFEFQFHVAAPVMIMAVILGMLANPGFEAGAGPQLRLPVVRSLAKVALAGAAGLLLAGTWLYGRADYHLARAQVAAAHGDAFLSQQQLNAAVAASPKLAEARYQRGLALLDKLTAEQRTPNHPVLQRAITDLEVAVKINPYRYLYALALADAYDAVGRHDDALKQIENALKQAPLYEETRMALAMHWHRLGDFHKAEQAYLWAGEAKAMNEEGTSRWTDNYRLLLQHAALMRQAPPVTAPKSN